MENSQLDDLLLQWEEFRDRGNPVSVEELCAQSPGLVDKVKRSIEMVELFDRIDSLEDAEPPSAANPVFDGYRTIRLLGAGGMGTVYLAEDQRLRRLVAIKVLKREIANSGEGSYASQRFEREAQTLAQLKHDHIVPIHQASLGQESPYFVMEHLPRTLAEPGQQERLRREGPKAVARFMAKVAGAVHFADTKGVLHRDLKPANILLDEQGEPKVCDFGLAKLVNDVASPPASPSGPTPGTRFEDTDKTASWTVADVQPGTPAYMAPEQLEPSLGPISPQTDVWALGVILYEFLTGEKPFAGRSRADLLEPVCKETPIPARQLNRRISYRLNQIISRCMAKNPRDRYDSAGSLAKELDRASKPVRRTALVVGGVCAVLAALALLFGLNTFDPHAQYLAGVQAHWPIFARERPWRSSTPMLSRRIF